jgi:hypothetical protein
MAKRWEDLTQAEKIEDLRRDVVKIMAAVNQQSRDLDQIRGQLNQLAEKLGEEYARVERREDLPAVLGLEGPTRPRGLLSRVRALLGGRR